VSESIGVYLARQRELRGISLDDLAAATRIPRHSLERLESGAFDARPDGFARAFVRTVAVALGLEPDATVNRMRAEPEGAGGVAGVWRGRWLLAIAAAALAVLAPLAWLNWIAAPRPAAQVGPASAVEPDVVYRPDAVRRLAEFMDAKRRGPDRGNR
jgi:hypothetical protein